MDPRQTKLFEQMDIACKQTIEDFKGPTSAESHEWSNGYIVTRSMDQHRGAVLWLFEKHLRALGATSIKFIDLGYSFHFVLKDLNTGLFHDLEHPLGVESPRQMGVHYRIKHLEFVFGDTFGPKVMEAREVLRVRYARRWEQMMRGIRNQIGVSMSCALMSEAEPGAMKQSG